MRTLKKFLLLIGSCLLCACQIEKPEAVEGNPVAVRDKDLAVLDGFGNRDYRHSQKGEWVLTEITQSAFGGGLLVTGYVLTQMRAIEKIDKLWKFRIYTNDITIKPDQTKTENEYIDEIVAEEGGDDPEVAAMESRKLQELVSRWRPSSTISPRSSTNSGFAACLPISSRMVKQLSAGYSVSYHSLNVTEAVQDPPRLIQQASQCQGLANCKMKVRRVVYDEVLRHEMGGVERYRCEYEFSDDVPYLGQMAKRCIHFMAKIDKKDVPIELCLSLANFERGTQSSPTSY